MKVLITLLKFSQTTGSELWAYYLSKELAALGVDVSILSDLKDGSLWKRGRSAGVKMYDFGQAPNSDYDYVIASHKPIIESLIHNKMYESAKLVSVNHSEVIQLEFPVVHKRIKHYVAIRPEITKFIENDYFIPQDKITLIYNPIDKHKFNRKLVKPPYKKTVLFVGTIDYLRKNSIIHLINKSKEENFNVLICGKKHSDYLDNISEENVRVIPPRWDIEQEYYRSTHTAGIMLGRTTIEGWFCGLPAMIYNVDKEGGIIGVETKEPPEDLVKFDSKEVALQYINLLNKL